MTPVNKGSEQPLTNRLSELQRQILAYLATTGQPQGITIGHLPRTGDIIDALGRQRDRAGWATVSRALARLEKAGLIDSYSPALATRGRGYHYALTTRR